MSDDAIRALAKRWLGPVLRGDCTSAFARQECISEVTYPYADPARYAHVRRIVASVIRP
jgi:hypothetical protein